MTIHTLLLLKSVMKHIVAPRLCAQTISVVVVVNTECARDSFTQSNSCMEQGGVVLQSLIHVHAMITLPMLIPPTMDVSARSSHDTFYRHFYDTIFDRFYDGDS